MDKATFSQTMASNIDEAKRSESKELGSGSKIKTIKNRYNLLNEITGIDVCLEKLRSHELTPPM